MNNAAAVFIGEPLVFNNQIKIYPPKVKDVVTNEGFGQYLKLFSLSQDDIREQLGGKAENDADLPNPFEFLLLNSQHNANFYQIVKEAFQFFIHDEITILFEQKLIIVGNLEQVVQSIDSLDDLVIINEDNYFQFQNAIRESCGMKPLDPPEKPNPDEDPRIAAMKAKARRRDKLKAKQQSKDGISLATSLTAICCMGLGITPLAIGEMSYAAIGKLTTMYQDKQKYETDIDCLLAGADSKKIKPKYWIREEE